MMRQTLTAILLGSSFVAAAQTGMDAAMASIKTNSKSIKAIQQYGQWQNKVTKTGNTPANPTVEYDYLFGFPSAGGNQKDFAVSQQIDFPTTYKYRSGVSKAMIEQIGFSQRSAEQDVLLEAKKVCLEIIYQNRRQYDLQTRLNLTQKLFAGIQKKYDVGEATVLELNRVKVQLVSAQNDLLLNKGKVRELHSRLTELNGGEPIALTDSIYPQPRAVPGFEELDSLIEANDPIVKAIEKDVEVNERRLSLERALTLPKLTGGYHSQSLLGQAYRGIHVGVTIPLWENRNKVKAQVLAVEYSNSKNEEHRVEHRFNNKVKYDRYEAVKEAIAETTGFMEKLTTVPMLNKALQLGQITSIDYTNELTLYYSLKDRLLELEKEYHVAVTELYKFEL
jgi:outer membrane protein, heavy metal efflux system